MRDERETYSRMPLVSSIAYVRDPAIVRGIPRFVEDEYYARSFGFQWVRHAKAQLDSTTGKHISRDRLFAATGWPARMDGERVLEAGCGAGRFTAVLATTGAEVFACDLSQAVEANDANHGHLPNVHIFQSDITSIPFAPHCFDRVLCLGVLQHTPNPAEAFRALATHVRPGGHLAIDVYRKDVAALLQWKYVLRPFTRRMDPAQLYRIVSRVVPILAPVARVARQIAGRAGARLLPIVDYTHLGLSPELNEEWSILDTFDMLSPVHDHPQTIRTVRSWFDDAGFVDVRVERGPNGIVGCGRSSGAMSAEAIPSSNGA